MQKHIRRLSCSLLMLGTLGGFSLPAIGACPGNSGNTNVLFIQAIAGGGYYIQLDATNPANDPCSCRVAGQNTVWLYRSETPATDSTKTQMALAMLARGLNKQIGYYSTGCYNNTPGSGYSNFNSLWSAP